MLETKMQGKPRNTHCASIYLPILIARTTPKRGGSLGKISGRNPVLPLDIPFRTAPDHVLGRMCQNDRFHTSKPTIFRFVYRVTCARRAMAGVGREAGRQRRPRRGRTALGSRMPLEYIV